MAQRLNPAARDAAVRRITMITTGVVGLGLAGTVGLGVTIASATPVKNKTKPATAVPAPQGKVTAPQQGQNKVAVPNAPTGTAPTGTAPKGTPQAPQKQAKPAAPAPKPQPTTQAPETSSGGS
jgi:hypothetical protein